MGFLRLTGVALLLLAFLACDEGSWLSEQAPYQSDVIVRPVPQAVPASQFGALTSVSVGRAVGRAGVCGVRADGSLNCRLEIGVEPPEGAFRSVSVGVRGGCGVREDGSVVCWGRQAAPPEGRFASVSVGWEHGCGVREVGSVVCWGNDEFGQSSPPEGRFLSVSTSVYYSCGVREDGSILCWSDEELEAAPSDGPFVSVSASPNSPPRCGVRDDGSVVCWGAFEGPLAAPHEGPFSSVTVGPSDGGETVACGLRENRTIACWRLEGNPGGSPENWPLDTLSQGKFISVSLGSHKGCAVREDGSATCWGDFPGNLAATLSVTDRTSTSLTVKWEQPQWEDGQKVDTLKRYYYQLHASRSPEGPYRLVDSGLAEVAHVVVDLEPGAVHYLALLICDEFECSQAMAVATTEADGPVSAPPTPSGFRGKKIVRGATLAADGAKLTWEAAAGATYYELWRGSDSDLPFELVAQINAPLEAQSFGVFPNRGLFGNYDLTSWRVRACNKAGCSPFTETVTVE